MVNENLIFASSRGYGNDENYLWNNQPYLDLYTVYKYGDDEFSEPSNFDSNVNTKFHESSIAYSPNGQNIYFTRNNFYKNTKQKDKKE